MASTHTDQQHTENGVKNPSPKGMLKNSSNTMDATPTDARRKSDSNLSRLSAESDEGKAILRKRAVNGNDSGSDTDSIRFHDDELFRRRSASVLEVKEHANSRLKEELLRAQAELMLKDEQCKKLEHVQDQMSEELEELTAKLFEEANKMVQDANIKRMRSEKLLKEANSKIEVLQAEVTALKTLVLTSTPSAPNKHLHPQLEAKKEKPATFIKGHRRSTSHHNFRKELTPIEIPVVPEPMTPPAEQKMVDPVYFKEFKDWRDCKPTRVDKTCDFLQHIIHEDILPCLSFHNKKMSHSVFQGVMGNTLTIEPVPGEKNPFPKKCMLTETQCICQFRIRTGDNEPWLVISQIVRNRIAAVCDFLTYVRYIVQGLVKSEDSDIYWEIIRLRKQMCLSRLGYS